MRQDLIIDEKQQVIFIPLRDRFKTIVDYGIVDLDDYDKIKNGTWHRVVDNDGKKYVQGRVYGKLTRMHDFINGKPPPGYVNDHRYSNGLDNRKSMLTLRTLSENAQNRIKEEGKYTSDYTGVYSDNDSYYLSRIQYKGEKIYIGSYQTEIEAAKAYDVYAIHYFGRDAKTNNTLTESEIENILKEGIPPEYLRDKIERELPKNIVITPYGKYNCKVIRNGKMVIKCGMDTVEEAVKVRDEIIAKLEKETPIQLKIPKKTKDGDYVIYLKDKNGKIVNETSVDAHLWKELIKYSWYLSSHDYVMGYPPDEHISLHCYLYIKYIGNIPEGYTVDHIDRNTLNNTLSNLRLADSSLQSHNKKLSERSITGYKGVSISGAKFVTCFMDKKYRFDYVEDAAKKYNELAKEKYGDNAYQNEISHTKTSVIEYFPQDVTVNYIKNIITINEFCLLVKAKKWGGPKGNFSASKLRIKDLEIYKEKAISLLLQEDEKINV